MVTRRRLYFAGRHHSLLKMIVTGENKGPRHSVELTDLVEAGYVFFDGIEYAATADGERVNDTWQNMKDTDQ